MSQQEEHTWWKSAMQTLTSATPWQAIMSGGSSLLFRDSGLEARYIIVRAAATRGASVSLRQVLLLALISGYTRCVYGAIAEQRLVTVRFIVLSVLFVAASLGQLFTIALLRVPETVHRDEWIRSISLVFTFVCWLILNILLKAGETPKTSPVVAAIYGAALILGDRLRLYASSQLIMLNLICFTLATLGSAFEGLGVRRLLLEVLLACLAAGALPTVGLAMWETSNREHFAALAAAAAEQDRIASQ